MHKPTSSELSLALEMGEGKPAWYRAMVLLGMAHPDIPARDLASLSIGHRNALLLEFRESLFGPTIDAFVECTECGEGLEFPIEVSELLEDYTAPSAAEQHELVHGDARVVYRLLCSHDLAADPRTELHAESARLSGCSLVEAVDGRGNSLSGGAFDDALLTLLAEAVDSHDPLANAAIPLQCAACENTWSPPFDVVSFVWTELKNLVYRLLDDVRILAGAYGWSEPDILAMSETRRQYYLESV